MRRVCLLLPLAVVLGCNEDVPGSAGFGSGADGGSPTAGESSGAQGTGGADGDDSNASSADTASDASSGGGTESATVCVEGRSVSTSASVQFDAYNPLTGIGNAGTMAHDWSMHATGLDLGHCFEVGTGVQAVRLDATGGSASLGVKRMRLVLHGAVY